MSKLFFFISPVTHFNSDHECFETYVGVETKSGLPGTIKYKVCGKTEAQSRLDAEKLVDILSWEKFITT